MEEEKESDEVWLPVAKYGPTQDDMSLSMSRKLKRKYPDIRPGAYVKVDLSQVRPPHCRNAHGFPVARSVESPGIKITGRADDFGDGMYFVRGFLETDPGNVESDPFGPTVILRYNGSSQKLRGWRDKERVWIDGDWMRLPDVLKIDYYGTLEVPPDMTPEKPRFALKTSRNQDLIYIIQSEGLIARCKSPLIEGSEGGHRIVHLGFGAAISAHGSKVSIAIQSGQLRCGMRESGTIRWESVQSSNQNLSPVMCKVNDDIICASKLIIWDGQIVLINCTGSIRCSKAELTDELVPSGEPCEAAFLGGSE